MVSSSTPPSNAFVRVARKAYNPLGFSKGYNFTLWFIFAGSLFGFSLSRIMYLDVNGQFCNPNAANHAALGECYYYQKFDREKIGIRLHLYTILPAAILAVFQFTPVIRHKFRLFHRLNGYTIIVLSLIGNIGALMIARHAFGGTLATQSYVGTNVLATTSGLGLALYNIKKLQIDQHRMWMLRTWFYFSSIITVRFIFVIAGIIISNAGDYVLAMPCGKLENIFSTSTTTPSPDLATLYPSCAAFLSGTDLSAYAVVKANLMGNDAESAAALSLSFGMAGWVALALHAIGVEIYIRLTPAETQRLRDFSYQRQLEAGFPNPGNAGLTALRIGDSKAMATTSNGGVIETYNLLAQGSGPGAQNGVKGPELRETHMRNSSE